MWLAAELASALVRSMVLLTDAVPAVKGYVGGDGGGDGGDGGGGGAEGGDGGDGGAGGDGGRGGGDGGGGGADGDGGGDGGEGGGGAKQIETVPETPVRVVAKVQTVAPETKTLAPSLSPAVFEWMLLDTSATVLEQQIWTPPPQ
jgi:hypothetical protein